MTPSIVRRLILKDLYLSRWVVIGSTVAGLLAIGIAPLSEVAFYVGSVSFVCVLIILNIFLVLVGVMQEKKDKVLLFILSLPISTTQYTFAKMAANLTAFVVPWLVLTAASLLVIDASGIPNGLMPFAAVIAGYLLTYYCVLLGVAIATESQAWITTVIVAGNLSTNFFIPLVFRLPSGGPHVSADTAIWGLDLIIVLVLEIVVAVAALVTGFAVQSRKKDFA